MKPVRGIKPVRPYVECRIGRELVHPGAVLLREWMRPFGISQQELARMLEVSLRRINEIVQGQRAITADTAVRLSNKLGMRPHYWLGLQADYDIRCVGRRERKHRPRDPDAIGPGRGWRRAITEQYRREKRREAIISLLEREDMEL
jgi:addiction module HigA family antidote